MPIVDMEHKEKILVYLEKILRCTYLLVVIFRKRVLKVIMEISIISSGVHL